MHTKKEISAGGIVFKKERSQTLWLITQHSQNKGWSFPKGLIGDAKKDEPMEEAALREVKEEGGVDAKIIQKLPTPITYQYSFDDVLVNKTVHYFLMEYSSGDPKDHDWEMMDAKFMTEEEIKKTLTHDADKKAFEEALKLFHQME